MSREKMDYRQAKTSRKGILMSPDNIGLKSTWELEEVKRLSSINPLI